MSSPAQLPGPPNSETHISYYIIILLHPKHHIIPTCQSNPPMNSDWNELSDLCGEFIFASGAVSFAAILKKSIWEHNTSLKIFWCGVFLHININARESVVEISVKIRRTIVIHDLLNTTCYLIWSLNLKHQHICTQTHINNTWSPMRSNLMQLAAQSEVDTCNSCILLLR